MAYSITEAKEQVIRAGVKLVETGLIARTWGNISARISDTQFVITPSGLAYETLTPDQIVTVNISDCTYEGDIKPSSEKGIHADAYKLRKEVNFIIHTHQEIASAIGIDGCSLQIGGEEDKRVLGSTIPCAAYGMPSTGKLKKAVATAIITNPESTAVLMKHHGTLCLGRDYENAFEIAQKLEHAAKEQYTQVCKKLPAMRRPQNYGSSERQGDSFMLTVDKTVKSYKVNGSHLNDPKEARLHAQIYSCTGVNYILHAVDDEVMAVSSSGRILKPLLDDLVQIAGINIRVVKDALNNPAIAASHLKNKNAVLLEHEGALCTGITESDAKAVQMVLRKGCLADLYASALHCKNQLGFFDSLIQRLVYVKKYSKQKK